jgi:hypothetical protein
MASKGKGTKRTGKKGAAGVAALEALKKNGGGGIGDDVLFNPGAGTGSGTDHQPEVPPEAGEKKPTKMPGETDSFRQVLQMMDAASESQLDAIVDYCSQRDLRNLPQLDNDLWDMGISNVNKRRRVITYWARSMGLAVDPNLMQHYRQLEPGSQPEVDITAGAPAKGGLRRYYIEEDSAGNPKMRMARPGESAMSLKEANEAIRELRSQHGKEGEQVITFNEQLQRHVPNTASEWVRNNLTAAWATAREYDRAMSQSGAEPPDPLDVMIDQMGKVEALKGVMGVAGATGEKPQSDMVQMVEALVRLNELTAGKRGSGWMDDPLQFMSTIKGIFPEKTEDPAISALREQNQTLVTKVGELQNQIIQSQFDALKEQNQQLAAAINDLRTRPAPGDPTPMTIMKDGVEKIAAEAAGVRKDIKDLGKDLILSGPGDAAGVVKKAMGNTARIEALTDELIASTE